MFLCLPGLSIQASLERAPPPNWIHPDHFLFVMGLCIWCVCVCVCCLLPVLPYHILHVCEEHSGNSTVSPQQMQIISSEQQQQWQHNWAKPAGGMRSVVEALNQRCCSTGKCTAPSRADGAAGPTQRWTAPLETARGLLSLGRVVLALVKTLPRFSREEEITAGLRAKSVSDADLFCQLIPTLVSS